MSFPKIKAIHVEHSQGDHRWDVTFRGEGPISLPKSGLYVRVVPADADWKLDGVVRPDAVRHLGDGKFRFRVELTPPRALKDFRASRHKVLLIDSDPSVAAAKSSTDLEADAVKILDVVNMHSFCPHLDDTHPCSETGTCAVKIPVLGT